MAQSFKVGFRILLISASAVAVVIPLAAISFVVLALIGY
jgi:hypothetical protein